MHVSGKKIVSTLGALMFASCGAQQSFDLAPAQSSFGQQVTYNDKVDILWVVDDSQTMAQHQSSVGSQSSAFIDALIATKLNFNMGIISTDRGNYGGRLLGSQKVLTKSTPNLKQTFASNIMLPLGSPTERGLLSMQDALSPSMLSGLNSGFLRSEAVLVVIFLTDENDQSTGASSSYINFLDTLKPNFPSGQKAWVAHFIGSMTLSPECLAFGPDASIGSRYMDLTNYSGGVNESICTVDLVQALTNIRKQVLELVTTFHLDREPEPSTIHVWINGVEIPEDPVNGWTYANQNITFHGSSVPPADAFISVDFKPKGFKP
jgi:hypothetical protein